MSHLRAYAIGIDEVRDIFGADAPLAARLRSAAHEKFFATKAPGKLGLLGPLFKRPPYRAETPFDPTPVEVEQLLTGLYVPAERLRQAWTLLGAWLDELAWGRFDLEATPADFEAFEFKLACAGLSSEFSLGSVLRHDASLPLPLLPGMALGYASFEHACVMSDQLDAVNVDDERARHLDAWLNRFSQWGRDAALRQRPAPDLVVAWVA